MKGILGRKLGMTQVFTTDGVLVPVTVVEATPNIVLQKKTMENDGYEAIQLGFEDKRSNLSNKAEQGHASKASTAPKRFIKEIRGSEMMSYEVGGAVDVNIFTVGEVIDVQGVSKGKGFQGAIKRHNYSIGPKAHGSGYHRGIGSMGPVDPARIFKGKKMAGHMGHETVTVQNLEIVAIDTENNLILVKGSIPGPKRGLVLVKSSIKHPGQVNQAATLVDLTPAKNEEVADEVVAEATAE